MKNLTPFILIVLLALAPSCKYFKGKNLFGRKDDKLAVLLARQDSIRVADSIMRVQERLMAIENARLDSIRIAEENALELRNRYNIIVGAFITPEYARALNEDYKQRGYESRIIKMEGSRFELISAESHESFRTAVARLNQFQDTVEIYSWMYIKE
ncbi:MAG: hypothetical protein MUC93_02380 [Bacteroidales bacterium]|jgi:hypothetical protein|nr:hypothetical protein [Bacteroidales bacterium]